MVVVVVVMLVDTLVVLGMLLIVPTGLRRLDDPAAALARRVWPIGAAAGAVSLWLPRGVGATSLAIAYAMAAAVLAAYALGRPPRPHRERPAEIAVLTALVSPSVAANALVAERAGYPLFGLKPDLLALTVAQLHLAAFAAALIAGLQTRTAPGKLADVAALTVPAGMLLVLIGYFTTGAVGLAGALVLATGIMTRWPAQGWDGAAAGHIRARLCARRRRDPYA
jgi:hypothetical protein